MIADERPEDDRAWLRSRRVYAIETVVFLLLLVPWMGLATIGERPQNLHFRAVAGVIIFQDVALTVLAVYFAWRNGEGVRGLGWIREGAAREALIGVALFVPMFVGIALIESLLYSAGLPKPTRPPSYLMPQGGADYAIALALLVVVAVAEETIFRGYLLRRFAQTTGRRWVAIVVTSVIFAFGHAYEGPLGAIAVGLIGAVFALVYVARGSLAGPITMHFIQDFIGLIIAPQFLTGQWLAGATIHLGAIWH